MIRPCHGTRPMRNTRRRLGRAGSASLEFSLLLWPFMALIFAGFDLGHYMAALNSLRTLVAEETRSAMINCASVSTGKLSASCNTDQLTTDQKRAIAPMLYLGSVQPTVSVSASGGVITFSASMASFPTILPWWGSIAGGLTASSKLYY